MAGQAGMMDQVLSEVTRKADPSGRAGYNGFWDNLMGFYHAVAWRDEPWLQLLLAAHAMLWAVAFFTRKRFGMQVAVFFFCCVAVRSAEAINTVASRRWREFSTQNYFDKNGVFLGVVYAMPLIFLLMFMVGNSLVQASNLLIVQKRAELRGIPPSGRKKVEGSKKNK